MGFYLDHQGTEGISPSSDARKIAPDTCGAPQDSQPAGARQSRVDLIQIIEGEIIPRLFLAHRNREPHPLVAADNDAGESGDCEFLARLFLGGNSTDILLRLQRLLDDGMRRDRLYLDLLAPLPRVLGRFWAEGVCSFDEIAVGLCCIDDVVRQLHEREQGPVDSHWRG